MKDRAYVPYAFLFPALLGILIFKLLPIAEGLKESLYASSFLAGEKTFTGLKNYGDLLTDPVFWNSVKITLLMNVVINPLQIVLALFLAILLNYHLRGIGFFRSIHYIPIAVSLPIACVLWSLMMNQEQGILNSLLIAVGLEPQPFLGSQDQALWAIIAIATWRGVGYWSIFLLAGLQEVPLSLYEAASIDGAGKWKRFKHVTIPMMKRPLIFVTVADTVTNFLLFAPMYILTKGGPQDSTNVLMNESFNSAFMYSDPGRASAIVMILLCIILIIITAQFKLFKAEH
ncbi:carbohydrate ABC transporter permease [Paenibacillus sp.]|uniref:carbohydrate ABC transporter permease n=1 Tax=Paenibacillus sp. TaxID=58172 RepID=UPI0035660A31